LVFHIVLAGVRSAVPAEVGHVEKWQLALDMIDEARSWGVEVPLVVADAGYGDATAVRLGLEERDVAYAVGISSRLTAHPRNARPVPPPTAATVGHRWRSTPTRPGR
jgi:SRSO17 transposase